MLGSASMWNDIATLVEHGFSKQEMIASRHDGDAVAGVQVSQVSRQDPGEKHVDYAMLTLSGQKKKIKM